MKICLDLRYKTESGASSYIKCLVPQLLKFDKKNQYTIIKYSEQIFEFEQNIENIMLSPTGLKQFLWDIFILPINFNRKKIDLYHTLKNPGFVWSITKRVKTANSITTDYKGNFPISSKRYLYHKIYTNYFTKTCTRVIAVSDFVSDFLIESLKIDPEKVDIVYHGINKRFQPIGNQEIRSVLNKYGLPEDYILSVGNITPVKNHITAVLAFNEILNKISTNLVIVGSTNNPYFKEVYKTAKEKNILDRVFFPGFINNNDLVAVMNKANAMIFPSLTEGCPVTMLEAFACGLPVIASKRGGLWDLGKDCAVFVDDPMDFKTFSQQIIRLLSSKSLRDEMRQKALARANEFTWERAAKATIETYNRCFISTEFR